MYLQLYLTSAIDGSGWDSPRHSHINPEESVSRSHVIESIICSRPGLTRMWMCISCFFWESTFDPSDILNLVQNTRRDLYRTTHNIHKRRTFTSPPGFEVTFSAGGRSYTHSLDSAANGIDNIWFKSTKRSNFVVLTVQYLIIYYIPTNCPN